MRSDWVIGPSVTPFCAPSPKGDLAFNIGKGAHIDIVANIRWDTDANVLKIAVIGT